jgi:hypothetical protein
MTRASNGAKEKYRVKEVCIGGKRSDDTKRADVQLQASTIEGERSQEAERGKQRGLAG